MFSFAPTRKDAGAVERARLESVCTSKGYRGFESLSFRINACYMQAFFVYGNFIFSFLADGTFVLWMLQADCTHLGLDMVSDFLMARQKGVATTLSFIKN